MRVEVNELRRFGCAAKRGFFNRHRIAHQRDDGAVVVRVALAVEQYDAAHRGDGGDDGVNDVAATTLAEVGDTFDELLHKCRLSTQ